MSDKSKPRSSSEELKGILKKEMDEAISRTPQIASGLANAQTEVTYLFDATVVSRSALDFLPTDFNYTEQIEHWRHVNSYLKTVQNSLPSLASGTAFVGTVAFSGIANSLSPSYIQQLPVYQREKAQTARNDISNILTSRERINRALEEMRRLGLDKRTYGRRAVEQLEQAWENHLQNAPGPALIPMRSTLDIAIDELVKMTQHLGQQGGVNEKIIALGQRVPASHTSPKDFERMQHEYKDLKATLSGVGKEQVLPREEERYILTKALNLLIEILSAIDEQKF